VYRGSGGMWFSGSKDRANTKGSDLEGITGSSYYNQEDVHCRSDMRQSSVCRSDLRHRDLLPVIQRVDLYFEQIIFFVEELGVVC
jgi:hypothetical protein